MQKKMPARIRSKQRKENIILALILAFLFIFVIYMSGRAYTTPDTTTSYTVQPGDTLWGIAETYCPESHTGNVVLKIERLNGISGYIQPGQVLEVPCEPQMFEATAYTWTGNRTATGTWPQEGRTVAADPNVLPYGTEISINGRPGYIVEDCGGNIKGNRLDIYVNDYSYAVHWGHQQVEVRIIEEG